MAGLDGTITIKSGEYRPCVIDGKKALFHRWMDKEELVLKMQCVMKSNDMRLIIERYKEMKCIPNCAEAEKITQTLAIVEFEDGAIREVLPTSVKFLDSGGLFHENGIFFKEV